MCTFCEGARYVFEYFRSVRAICVNVLSSVACVDFLTHCNLAAAATQCMCALCERVRLLWECEPTLCECACECVYEFLCHFCEFSVCASVREHVRAVCACVGFLRANFVKAYVCACIITMEMLSVNV